MNANDENKYTLSVFYLSAKNLLVTKTLRKFLAKLICFKAVMLVTHSISKNGKPIPEVLVFQPYVFLSLSCLSLPQFLICNVSPQMILSL